MTNLSGSYEAMSVEDMRGEIIRLRGEISSACWNIAFLYELLLRFVGDDDLRSLFIDKIRNNRLGEVSLALLGDRGLKASIVSMNALRNISRTVSRMILLLSMIPPYAIRS